MSFEKRTQRDYRGYSEEWMDNHGRRFAGWFETSSMKPVGPLTPIGHNPPWLPPMKYIKWEGAHSFRFAWDYDALAEEWASMTASYYEDATAFALERGLPVPELGGEVDFRVRAVKGKPPLSPAIPLACKLGNQWILGVPGVAVDPMLKACLTQSVGHNSREALEKIQAALDARHAGVETVPSIPLSFDVDKAQKAKTIHDIDYDPASVTYAEFSKALFAQGKKQGEIVELWREHKSLLGVA